MCILWCYNRSRINSRDVQCRWLSVWSIYFNFNTLSYQNYFFPVGIADVLDTCENTRREGRLHAVKCNLTELTTKSPSLTRAVSGLLDMRMRQDSSCSWSIGHCSGFVGVSVRVFLSVSVFPERGDSLEAVSPPLFLPFFPLFYQCDGCLFFLLLCGGSWLG